MIKLWIGLIFNITLVGFVILLNYSEIALMISTVIFLIGFLTIGSYYIGEAIYYMWKD